MRFYKKILLALAITLLFGLAHSALAAMPYRLYVDLEHQVVVAVDNLTDKPVRYMLCSSGKASTPTRKGTFVLPKSGSKSWMAFGSCYVRYPTRIKGGYYFHSILYGRKTTASLNRESWNKLGSRASHGCVRLAPIDAQWISYNCKKGTVVYIGNNAGQNYGVNWDKKHELLHAKNSLGHAGVQPTLKPTPTPPPPTFALGDKHTRVKALKLMLKQHGYFNGSTTDATFNAAAVEAWKEYEKDAGLTEDGIATPDEQGTLSKDGEHVAYNCTLTKGFSGLIVKKVEDRLKELGFFTGATASKYDNATINAVKKFQKTAGLAVTGKADPATQNLLFSSAAPTPTPKPDLQLGSKGSEVKAMQNRLISLGFLGGKASGTFNAATEKAVKLYQEAAGLSATGVADNALQLKILNDNSLTGTNRTLKKGSKGVVVMVMKQRLNKLGFVGASAVNQTYNASTAKAIKRFQKANGLKANGVATIATQTKLAELAP